MIEVETAGLSASGRVRTENEDAHLIVVPPEDAVRERHGILIAVADGLGGLAAGEVASQTAVKSLEDAYFAPTAPTRIEPRIQHAFQIANLRVHDAARANPARRGMQTTLTAIALTPVGGFVAHIGDSRAYLWRRGELRRLTDDHSEAAELVRMKLARADSLADHPRRNVLTRTLGQQLIVRPDFRHQTIEPEDRFLLCSDGLWSEVSDLEISEALAVGSPQDIVRALIDAQCSRASLDNVTAVVVKVVAIESPPKEDVGWLSGVVGRLIGPRPDPNARIRGRGGA